MEQDNERFEAAIKYLKSKRKISGYKDIGAPLGISVSAISEMVAGRSRPSKEAANYLQDKYRINADWILSGEGQMLLEDSNTGEPTETYKLSGDEIRNRKAFEPKRQRGILAVPVKAQAGYARMLHDDFAVLMDQLDRVSIPDFPYDGDEFRMFQVEGDSMEYVNEHGRVAGLQNGIWVVGQRVPQEDWRENLALYRVHVVVLARQTLIKRILRDNPDEIILHSDNDEMHPQERIKLADVQEIWYVVRKLDWDMPPPRRIQITV